MVNDQQLLLQCIHYSSNGEIMSDNSHSTSPIVYWMIGIVLLGVLFLMYRQSTPARIIVKTHTVSKGRVSSTVSNTRVGTIKACRRSYLAPTTGGQLARLLTAEGDKIKQGQLLMEIWNKDLLAQQKLQQATIAMQQAKTRQRCTLAGGAHREARRLLKLRRKNQIVSEEQVDQAETHAKAQSAACAAAKLTIDVHQAELEKVNAAIEQTRVYAPFDGIVAEINAELGEFVTPSPPGIPTLPPIDMLDISCLYVSAPIDEVDAPKIKTGMSACVLLDAFTEKRCSGTVTRIAPYVLEKEKQARTVEVEVKLTDAKDLTELLPGYSADIEILLAEKKQVLRIPTSTILDGHLVYKVNSDGQLKKSNITTGIQNWQYTHVLTGLDEGDQIILSTAQEGLAEDIFVSIEND